MTMEDRTKYESLFPRYDEDGDGFIQGKEAVELLSKSGLERPVLKKVRTLITTNHPVISCPIYSVIFF